MRLELTIPAALMPKGKPHGWMRVVPAVIGGRARPLTPKRERDYQRAVLQLAMVEAKRQGLSLPLTGPLSVEVIALFGAPKSYPQRRGKWATSKPDADNIAKSVLDALEPAIIERDQNVVELQIAKRYARAGEKHRVVVTVEQV